MNVYLVNEKLLFELGGEKLSVGWGEGGVSRLEEVVERKRNGNGVQLLHFALWLRLFVLAPWVLWVILVRSGLGDDYIDCDSEGEFLGSVSVQ